MLSYEITYSDELTEKYHLSLQFPSAFYRVFGHLSARCIGFVSRNCAVWFTLTALIKLVRENSYDKLFLYRNKTNKCKDELVNKVEH